MTSLKNANFLILALFLGGCATGVNPHSGESFPSRPLDKWAALDSYSLAPGLEEKILALDPERITAADVRDVLSQAPAPRIINIHGGIVNVYLQMVSFSDFLTGMGYPLKSVRGPGEGAYSYTCYDDSKKLAGLVGWHYERDAMKPMIIGHSQGGMQAVKVLHDLAGNFGKELKVWNPIEQKFEDRIIIRDPFTGILRPVMGLKVCYATSVGAGGLTRLLVNQWAITGRLRTVPDTAETFTGFYMGLDWTGGDFFGFGPMNKHHSAGSSKVRNVHLPLGYDHTTVPDTRHLVKDDEVKAWIDTYVPSEEPQFKEKFKGSTRNILWAADVWYDVKKNWCLELQKMIRAKRRRQESKVWVRNAV